MTMNEVSRNSTLTEAPVAAAMVGVRMSRRGGAGKMLDGARALRVEYAETFLRVHGHVGHADLAAHEGDPRLLRERLQPGEVPELPLVHFDLGDALVQHPAPQRGEPGLFGLSEH